MVHQESKAHTPRPHRQCNAPRRYGDAFAATALRARLTTNIKGVIDVM
jgi:hypothetical protein